MSYDVLLRSVCVSVYTVFSMSSEQDADLRVPQLELLLSRFTIKKETICQQWKPWLPTLSVKYSSASLVKRLQKRSCGVGAWNNSVSACHVRMNGSLVSLVWLGMEGGAGWSPQVPAVIRPPGDDLESGWGRLVLCPRKSHDGGGRMHVKHDMDERCMSQQVLTPMFLKKLCLIIHLESQLINSVYFYKR